MPKTHPNLLTKDEKRAVNILENICDFIKGKYQVGLLWKKDKPVLPYNRNLASKRLENFKKKLSKDQLLAKRYSETINTYISKGYAPKIESTQGSQRNNITNYIPHHGVINQHKPNKLRVVSDASAKYKGHSLNDYFLVRPDLLNNLVSTIIRFRLGKYAVSGDIEQMFHQISVSPKDRDALRFLWRENSNEVVSDYTMNVHLFGKNDSPCVANFALKTVISVLKESGFRLTKFVSNNQDILNQLPETEILNNKAIAEQSDQESTHKTLGILWNVNSDELRIKFSDKTFLNTKRGLLSLLCSIFDPIGLVSPCLTEPKLIIQELWKRKVD